ncbi:hypothetical protein, partial [Staphylococcus aureus]|uniref:hypothetical protein n=1 Tax=Staphylococcus aureus TaxID=1280 RepID=UPI001F15CB75
MSRLASLQEAAGLALSGETGHGPQAATAECVRATLDDPALEEALGTAAAFQRQAQVGHCARTMLVHRRNAELQIGGD